MSGVTSARTKARPGTRDSPSEISNDSNVWNVFTCETSVLGPHDQAVKSDLCLSGSSGKFPSCRVGIAHQGLNPGRSHEIGGQCPPYGKATCRIHHLEAIRIEFGRVKSEKMGGRGGAQRGPGDRPRLIPGASKTRPRPPKSRILLSEFSFRIVSYPRTNLMTRAELTSSATGVCHGPLSAREG